MGMSSTKNDKKSAEEPSSEAQQRHKQAKDFTRQMMEELLTPPDTSDKSGRADNSLHK